MCKGRRYNRETLEVRYKGNSIADVLDLTVADGLEFFEAPAQIAEKLDLLNDVDWGTSIWARRRRPCLAAKLRGEAGYELAKRDTAGRSTFSTSRQPDHFEDVRLLLEVLHRLVDKGNSVIVIEHNLDVIKTADWIIDLGPEGKRGDRRGAGPPEDVMRKAASYTGQFLKKVMSKSA